MIISYFTQKQTNKQHRDERVRVMSQTLCTVAMATGVKAPALALAAEAEAQSHEHVKGHGFNEDDPEDEDRQGHQVHQRSVVDGVVVH